MGAPTPEGISSRSGSRSGSRDVKRASLAKQVIPRPSEWAEGDPAPWASLAGELRAKTTLELVRAAVENMASALSSEERVSFDGLPEPRGPAAVLVPLFEEHGETRVVLTRRAAHLRTHTGQVSFPGGRLDAGETPEAAALREAEEEISLAPEMVELIGRLSPLATFSSRAAITPVVGILSGRPLVVANPSEVERVFDVALADLAQGGVFHEERWQVSSTDSIPMWFFELDHDTIWGATARILVELLRIVFSV